MTSSSKIGRIINLGSSSEGNAFYIELGGKNILIECGFDYKELLRRMIKNGIDINKVDAVLVTHHHSDHSKSVKELINANVKVYAPHTVFKHYNIDTYAHFIMEEYQKKEIFDGITVLPIPLEHYDKDTKVYNLGYVISVGDDFKMLFVIDTKFIPQDLSNIKFDLIFIEANYIRDNVYFALRDANRNKDVGKQARYKRLLDSHFSIENMVQTLDGTINKNSNPYDLSKTKMIFLTHISSNTLTNESYYRTFVANYLMATKERTKVKEDCKVIVCKKEGDFLR